MFNFVYFQSKLTNNDTNVEITKNILLTHFKFTKQRRTKKIWVGYLNEDTKKLKTFEDIYEKKHPHNVQETLISKGDKSLS